MGIINVLFESVVACIVLQLCAGKRIEESDLRLENLPDYDQGDYSDYSYSHDLGSDLDFSSRHNRRKASVFPSDRFLRSRSSPSSYEYDDLYDVETSEGEVVRKIQNLIASEEQRRGNNVGFYRLLSAQVDAVRKEEEDKTGIRINNKNCLCRLLKRLVHISPLVKRRVKSRSAELLDELEQFEDWARLRRVKKDLKDMGPSPKKVRNSVAKIHPKKVIEDIKHSFEKTPLIFDKASKITADSSEVDEAMSESSLKATKLSGLRKRWKDHMQPPLTYKVHAEDSLDHDESSLDFPLDVTSPIPVNGAHPLKRMTDSPIRSSPVKKTNDASTRDMIKDMIRGSDRSISRKNVTDADEDPDSEESSDPDEYESFEDATTRAPEDHPEELQDADEPPSDMEEKNKSKSDLGQDDDDSDGGPDFVIDKIDLHIKKAPSARTRDSERKLKKDDLLRLRIPIEDDSAVVGKDVKKFEKYPTTKFLNTNVFRKRKGDKLV